MTAVARSAANTTAPANPTTKPASRQYALRGLSRPSPTVSMTLNAMTSSAGANTPCNTVITQMGFNAQSIVMNVGSAAAGYGYEYVASTLDRVKDAALKQADAMLEMPIMTPVSADTWGVKEAVMSEEDMPEWGSQEERGIEMEITTAAAVLAGGSDAVILRHPEAVKTIAKMIDALM